MTTSKTTTDGRKLCEWREECAADGNEPPADERCDEPCQKCHPAAFAHYAAKEAGNK